MILSEAAEVMIPSMVAQNRLRLTIHVLDGGEAAEDTLVVSDWNRNSHDKYLSCCIKNFENLTDGTEAGGT